MRKKGIAVVMTFVLLVAALTGCKAEPQEKPGRKPENKKKSEVRIGITFDTFVLERWTKDRDVFVSTAQKMGAVVDVQTANGDVEEQKRQIRKFAEEDMDAIVIIAADCFQLADEVREARNKGIHVISYDRLIQGEQTDLYVTVDNEKVGQLMAEEIKKQLPEGGNVVMICGPEADTNSQDVVSGFEKELGDGPWKVVYKDFVKSWAPENSTQAVEEAFENTTDIDAIMCGNDGLAGYVIRALSEQQLAGQVVVVGQDADLEACQRVVEGTQSMTVYKPIEELAKVAAECTVKMAKGETVVGKVIGVSDVKKNKDGDSVPYYALEPIAVTAENMDEVVVKSGFHLKDEVYLNVGEEQEPDNLKQ